MARQYKIEVDYPTGPNAEIYWHDNATVEFVTVPQPGAPSALGIRINLLEQIINFMKAEKVISIEVSKIP